MDKIRGFEKVSFNCFYYGNSLPYDKKTYDRIKIPQRSTKYSAGYDIFSTINFDLDPKEEITFPLGFKVYMPQNEFFMIVPRSGLGFKYFTRLANTVGIIDSDYYGNKKNEGHCWIKIRNESKNDCLHIKEGDSIAQGIFMNYLLADGDSFTDKNLAERGGGFGSTDKS